MDVRPYAKEDRCSCLELFDSNTPRYFAEAERSSFETFLDSPNCPYFVLMHDGAIVACGGYAVKAEQQLASLVWGMVRADLHKHGIGRFLLLFRLREIGKQGAIELVRLDTSPESAGFFGKQGFKVLDTVQDGFGSGLNRVEMIKKLTVCA